MANHSRATTSKLFAARSALADLGAERQSAAGARQRLKALEETRLSGELESIRALLIQQTAIIKEMAGAGERKAAKKTEVGDPGPERR